MTVTAEQVKQLREHTGAGMMECKKALAEADGDFEKAVEVLRIKGGAKAAKRQGERTASNGLVGDEIRGIAVGAVNEVVAHEVASFRRFR